MRNVFKNLLFKFNSGKSSDFNARGKCLRSVPFSLFFSRVVAKGERFIQSALHNDMYNCFKSSRNTSFGLMKSYKRGREKHPIFLKEEFARSN